MDIQKMMEFILEQQAASVAKQVVFETNIARLMESQHNSEQRIARNVAALERNEASIEALIESQLRTDAKLDRLGEYIKEVSAGVDHLKDRVDALVLVADSMIRRPPEA